MPPNANRSSHIGHHGAGQQRRRRSAIDGAQQQPLAGGIRPAGRRRTGHGGQVAARTGARRCGGAIASRLRRAAVRSQSGSTESDEANGVGDVGAVSAVAVVVGGCLAANGERLLAHMNIFHRWFTCCMDHEAGARVALKNLLATIHLLVEENCLCTITADRLVVVVWS